MKPSDPTFEGFRVKARSASRILARSLELLGRKSDTTVMVTNCSHLRPPFPPLHSHRYGYVPSVYKSENGFTGKRVLCNYVGKNGQKKRHNTFLCNYVMTVR